MSKGKCYSLVDRGQRRKADDYPTHFSLTALFLERESFANCHTIWEPCAGKGAMVSVILSKCKQHEIDQTDKYYEGYKYVGGEAVCEYTPYDMLNNKNILINKRDAIITNPPYSIFLDIIKKAKEMTNKKIAMLLPLSYLQGQERYDHLWNDTKFPLSRIYVFNRFPDMSAPLRDDGKFPTGMMALAWYVWEKGIDHKPEIEFIDCRQYVLTRGDI